jgi:hypothetical protein
MNAKEHGEIMRTNTGRVLSGVVVEEGASPHLGPGVILDIR